jgi:hypothetical protein
MQKKIPHICPACASPLKVTSLACEQCQTIVSGVFDLPVLGRFTQEEQNFIIDFVKSSGSLKIMAQKLGLSYPTVRNLLDDIILKMEQNQKTTKQPK